MSAQKDGVGSSWGLLGSSRRLLGRRRGFTLIELLVVIGIIAVLAAIIIPVYARAQEKGRQAHCISNMHAIAVAIKMYYLDYRAYPQPYDPVTGWGGVTALYRADYLTNAKSLRCPDDQSQLPEYMTLYASLQDQYSLGFTGPTIAEPDNPNYGSAWDDAADNGRYYRDHYSSYNCMPGVDPGASSGQATVPYQVYNAYGYNADGLSLLSAPVGYGGKYPGLCNNWAPDETIVSHCPYHRAFFGNAATWQDIVVRLGGDAALMRIANYDWVNQPPQ
jgi:prepilin-type N-terminal cleavage/methylation domain-containing protein